MKIELEKDDILFLNELCFDEILNLGKIENNKFIDKIQIETRIENLKYISNKLLDTLEIDK